MGAVRPERLPGAGPACGSCFEVYYIFAAMKVFKFGGASVNSSERIRNVAEILRRHESEQVLVVISAMGKTTNALEKVAEAFYNGSKEEALRLFNEIKNQHLQILQDLMGTPVDTTSNQLLNFFTEVEWLLHDKPVRNFDYYYDQVVCVGELLSTSIVSQYLTHAGIKNEWIDVRDVIRTDDNFRDAKIDWQYTQQKVAESILPAFGKSNIIITQGFIGSTDENESTTLGREGSDYTAAVFANLLNAESLTIWKDVQGVMNADPKQYSKAEWIQELDYREVIEMAYYGAQVIHPKTIKPLQNKNIPMYVRSFIKPEAEGTIINNQLSKQLPPIIVRKEQQAMVTMSSKDFSFVSEGLNTTMAEIFDGIRMKPNLTQNAAISLFYVVDDKPEKLQKLASKAAELFDVSVQKNLCLLTIRHYNDALVKDLVGNANIVLTQRTPETIQILMVDQC